MDFIVEKPINHKEELQHYKITVETILYELKTSDLIVIQRLINARLKELNQLENEENE